MDVWTGEVTVYINRQLKYMYLPFRPEVLPLASMNVKFYVI